MKNVARNLLNNSSDAEDAVQETFLKVQRSIAGFRGQSSFVTWTYRILINTCYDARRGRLRKKEVANGRWLGSRSTSAMFFFFMKWKAFTMLRSPRCWPSRRPLLRTRFFRRRRIFAKCLSRRAAAAR